MIDRYIAGVVYPSTKHVLGRSCLNSKTGNPPPLRLDSSKHANGMELHGPSDRGRRSVVHCRQWHMWIRWIPVLSASLLTTRRYCRRLVGGANAGLLVVDTSLVGFECMTAETRYEDDECWTAGTMADVLHPWLHDSSVHVSIVMQESLE